SVNFLTGVRPGMPFQTSISRSAGHSATRLDSSCLLLKLSPSPASCLVACAVMLFSVSIVYVVISLFPCAACCGHDIDHSGRRNKQVNLCGIGRARTRLVAGDDRRGPASAGMEGWGRPHPQYPFFRLGPPFDL